MARKPTIGFNVDTAEAAALTGFLKQLSLEIKSTRHIDPVLRYVHSVMSDEFTDHMTVIAPVQPGRFHHVYEWGQIGDPRAKLWNDKLIGRGSSRIATFTWKASKQVVPVREDFKQLGVKKIHVFVWKAPVMEYSRNIEIEPKRGRFLAYFTGPSTPENKYDMGFTSKPINVENPGGPLVKGSFTREYVRWWGGAPAENVFDQRIRQTLERDLGAMPIESATKPFRKARTKVFGMQAIANAQAAEKAGAAAARKYLQGRSRRYIDAARARERFTE